ncbi:unnamed protein product [Blepharisma stoltei]|uniref:Uncharacterized protein n=1 Tax=Blepharisma stoltei TaxID=1481888 RepID=A0AAU9J619_9CILI|nr:unnamed protein product [Blepharisma stoltei]
MAVVVDTGPLIKGKDIRSLGQDFYTVPQVIQEVRDKHARALLSLHLEEIKTTEPTEEDLSYTLEFARKTGDIRSLSATDIKVIALACRLERERGGLLKSEPGEIRSNENQVHRMDNEWITPENFKSTPDSRVCVLTLDYAIQNVAIQMGLRLLSLGGLEIKYLKRWVQKCRSCHEICEDPEKEFCEACGNHTLYKISYSIDAEGKTQYHEPRKTKNNLRGQVYPVPTPKGGKNNSDLILREDQLLMMGGRQNKWNWKKPDVYDPESIEAFGYNLQVKNPHKYGPDRRNPNEPLRKSKKRS